MCARPLRGGPHTKRNLNVKLAQAQRFRHASAVPEKAPEGPSGLRSIMAYAFSSSSRAPEDGAQRKGSEYDLVCTSDGETPLLSNKAAELQSLLFIDRFALNTADEAAVAGQALSKHRL